MFLSACCSVLQCIAVCCSVLQCIAVCYSVLQCVAACCSVLHSVAVCCSVCSSVLQCVAVQSRWIGPLLYAHVFCSVSFHLQLRSAESAWNFCAVLVCVDISYMYTYKCTRILQVCIYVPTCIHICAYMYTYMCPCVHMHLCKYIDVHIHEVCDSHCHRVRKKGRKKGTKSSKRER